MDLVNSKAAYIMEEKDLDGKKLVDMVDYILNTPIKIEIIKNNLNKLKVDNSASIIYENIKKLIDRKWTWLQKI